MAVKHIFTEEEINNILNLYTHNKSMLFISKEYNVGTRVIKRVLKENNISIRDNNTYKQKYFNENYFETITTENQAYWLGFLWGDGSIHCNKNGQYCISLNLSIEDKSHLEKFKQEINSEHKITIAKNKWGFNKNNTEPHYYCAFCIHSLKTYNDLLKYGLYNPKSKRILPKLNPSLMSHFIRGYFDADGSLTINKNTKTGIVSFCGPIEIISQIKPIIQQHCNTKSEIYKYKTRNAADYRVGGTNNIKALYNYLYKDATIYLERKKEKFDTLIS